MKVLYFTSTGNSLYVARQFTESPISIVGLLKEGNFEVEDAEAIGVVIPDHVSGVPQPVREYLQKATLKSPYLFGIVTYGSKLMTAVTELVKMQPFNYANSILMVDNYFPMFNQQNQIESSSSKNIESHLSKLVKDVNDRKCFISQPSFFAKIGAPFMHAFFPLLGHGFKKFSIEKNKCVKCGICAKVCPIDNITYNPWPVIADKCIVCGACRQNCPQNAIRFKGERDKVQYRNTNVSLSDIVNANNF